MQLILLICDHNLPVSSWILIMCFHTSSFIDIVIGPQGLHFIDFILKPYDTILYHLFPEDVCYSFKKGAESLL